MSWMYIMRCKGVESRRRAMNVALLQRFSSPRVVLVDDEFRRRVVQRPRERISLTNLKSANYEIAPFN